MPPAHFAREDLLRAAALLTRLPLPDQEGSRSMAQSAWSWPIIGALVGLGAGLAALIAGWMGLPPLLAATCALGVQIALTGALHEDGLADCADGFWGGQTRARRLEIMKDSRLGSYGMLALALALFARIAAIAALIEAGWLLAPLIATGALSRAPMAVLMTALPNARGAGLAHAAGRPGRDTALVAIALALLIGLLATGWAVLVAGFWTALAVLGWALLARGRIGGQTGDVLGAAQQIGEIVILAVFAAMAT